MSHHLSHKTFPAESYLTSRSQTVLQEEHQPGGIPVDLEHNKYATLFHALPVGFVTLNRTGKVSEANHTFARMAGKPPEDIVASPFDAVLCKECHERWDAFLQKVFQSDTRLSFDARLIASAAHEPVDVLIDGVADAMNEVCLLTITDISGRKKTETLNHIKCRLEAAGNMAGGIAHDFNNLLSVILLNLELSRDMIENDHELEPMLHEAERAVAQAARLIKRLAMLANNAHPSCRRMAVNSIFHQCAALMIGDTGIKLIPDLAPDLWAAELDPEQFELVIRHLVLNAREAMPQGGELKLISTNTELPDDNITTLPAGRYIKLSIIDQGCGIDRADRERIFDPYYSTKSRGATKGVGIGLSLCHAIITRHRGGLIIDSEPGSGTRVDLYVPAHAGEPEIAELSAIRKRILLMEDDKHVRKTLGRLLARLDYDVTPAGTGEEAVALYRDAKKKGQPFHAVILEQQVRGWMDGQNTLLMLRQVDPYLRAIMMSSYDRITDLVNFERLGFDDFLIKPCTQHDLKKALERTLAA